MIEETHDKLGDALLESLASDGEASVESGMTEERGEELSEPIVNAVDETEASQGTKSEKQLSAVAEAAAKGLNPIDDLFFSKMAEDPAVCAEIISTIIRQPIRVLKVVPQNSIINLQGHSVRLDALADIEQEIVTVEAEVTEDCPIGKKGARVNIEVQKSDDDDFERRVLYNAAAVLLNSMPAGEPKYRNMPDVLVILISKFDVFKDGKMVYEIQRVIKGTKKVVYNGMREYYVNTVVRDRSEGWLSDIADLMNIFVDPEAYDSDKFPHFSELKALFQGDARGST